MPLLNLKTRFAHFCVSDPSRREFGRRLLGLIAGLGLFGREAARQKSVMMNTFSIAGMAYYPGIHHLDRLSVEQPLRLIPEPENPHDEFAVKILTDDGLMLGYVPRSDNKAISRLLTAGLPLAARISGIHPDEATWQHVQIQVLMIV